MSGSSGAVFGIKLSLDGAPAVESGLKRIAQAGTNAGKELGAGVGLAGHQITNLTYQLQDAAVQLAGGQNPLLILMQQGPQATAAVGGVGNAFKLLVSAITPLRLAVGTVSVGVIASLVAFESQERRLASLRNQLRGYRSEYEETARAIERDSRRQSLAEPSLSRTDVSRARTRLSQVLPDGFDLDALTRQAADLAATLDGDLDGAVQRIGRAFKDPAAMARELAEQRFPGMTEALRRSIEIMQLGGDRAGAFGEVMRILGAQLNKARDDVSPFEAAMREARKSVAGIWDDVSPGLEAGGQKLLEWFTTAISKAREFRETMGNLSMGERLSAAAAAITPGGAGQVISAYATARARQGAASGGAEPAGTGPSGASREAFDFFTAQGWSPAQASGLVANLHAESGLDAGAFNSVGGGNGAFGIAQWRGARQDALRDFLGGRDIRTATLQDQLAFVQHELTAGGETAAGRALRGASSAAEAGSIVSRLYERPGSEVEAIRRAGLAQTLGRQFAESPSPQAVAVAATVTAPAADLPLPPPADPRAAGARTDLDAEMRAVRDLRTPSVQRENLDAEMERWRKLRDAQDAGSEGYRIAGEAMQRVQRDINGLEDPLQRQIRGLREQADAAQVSEGAARELAQAEQALREAARSEGREVRPEELAAARSEVMRRLAAESQDAADALGRQIQAETRIAEAWRTGAAAAQEVEARERAREEVRHTTLAGTDQEAAAVEKLTQKYLDLARAQTARQLAAQADGQDRTAALTQEQIRLQSQPERERTAALARFQAQQNLEAQSPGSSATEEGRRVIDNAERNANLTTDLRRVKEAEALGAEVGSAFFDAFQGAVMDGKSWKDVYKGLSTALANIANRELIEKPLQQLFGSIVAELRASLASQSSGGSGGSALSGVGSWIAGLVGGSSGGGGGATEAGVDKLASGMDFSGDSFLFHSGGVAGNAAPTRSVSAHIFREAPRYHSGGVAGMAPWIGPDEVPAILRRREAVLTERQQEAVARRMAGAGRGGGTVIMNVQARDADSFRASSAQIGVGMHRALRHAMRSV